MQNCYKSNPYSGSVLDINIAKQLVRNIVNLCESKSILLSDGKSKIETIFIGLDLVRTIYNVLGIDYQESVTGDKEIDNKNFLESITSNIEKFIKYYDGGIFMGFVKKNKDYYLILDTTDESVRQALRDGSLFAPTGDEPVDDKVSLDDQKETTGDYSPQISTLLECFGIQLEDVIDETIENIKLKDLEKTRKEFENLVIKHNEKVEQLFTSNSKWGHIMEAAKQLNPNITPEYLNQYSALSILNNQYVDDNFDLISIFKAYIPTIENAATDINPDLKLPVIFVDGTGLFVEITGKVKIDVNSKLYSMEEINDELTELVYKIRVIPNVWFYHTDNLSDHYKDIIEYLNTDFYKIDSISTFETILGYQYIKLKENIDKILGLYVKIFQYMLVASNMQKLDNYDLIS
jgi:rRNA pseudouridine-1189 N-methylase Emg1 (Nep1/Mra1 family)